VTIAKLLEGEAVRRPRAAALQRACRIRIAPELPAGRSSPPQRRSCRAKLTLPTTCRMHGLKDLPKRSAFAPAKAGGKAQSVRGGLPKQPGSGRRLRLPGAGRAKARWLQANLFLWDAFLPFRLCPGPHTPGRPAPLVRPTPRMRWEGLEGRDLRMRLNITPTADPCAPWNKLPRPGLERCCQPFICWHCLGRPYNNGPPAMGAWIEANTPEAVMAEVSALLARLPSPMPRNGQFHDP